MPGDGKKLLRGGIMARTKLHQEDSSLGFYSSLIIYCVSLALFIDAISSGDLKKALIVLGTFVFIRTFL